MCPLTKKKKKCAELIILTPSLSQKSINVLWTNGREIPCEHQSILIMECLTPIETRAIFNPDEKQAYQ